MNIKEFLKKYLEQILKYILGLSALFIIVDYLLKWGIVSFLFNSFLDFKKNFQLYLIVIAFIWLLVLTVLFIRYRFNKKIINIENKKEDLEKLLKSEISVKEKHFLEELGKLERRLKIKIEDDVSDLRREVLDLKTDIPFKEENMGDLIKILNLDIKKGWEWRIDETLERILKNIEKKGMPNTYISDLNKALNSLSEAYKLQKEAISKLMYEKRH